MTRRAQYDAAVAAYESSRVAYGADPGNDELRRLMDQAERRMDSARDELAASDEPREYVLSDGGGGEDTCVCTPSEIEEEWHEWMADGDWEAETETAWIYGSATDEFGRAHLYNYAVEPAEPTCDEADHACDEADHACDEAEHEWVMGHGGGASGTDICRHCGVYRHWDSWAQDPATGRIEYRDADEESRAYVWGCLASEAEKVAAPDGYTIARAHGRDAIVVTRESDLEVIEVDEITDLRRITADRSWARIVRRMPAEGVASADV